MNKEAVISLLQQHSIQTTKQRINIAQILFEKPQHLSADQILSKVNQDRNQVSKATVYNSLGLFARNGLVREIIVDPNRVFYDSNTSDHFHFYNIDTKELSDISKNDISVNLLQKLPDGIVTDSVDVIINVKNTPERSS